MSLQTFTRAYIDCALWSSQDVAGFAVSPECKAQMEADCAAFYEANSDHMEDDEQGGHDFWLTRCGHGAGFWDGDWPEPQASILDAAAQSFGNVDLYVGDDHRIYAA